MVFQVRAERRVAKEINHYPLKHQIQIKQKIKSLRDNPWPNDAKKIKNSLHYRCTVGEYRLIYEVNEGIIDIIIVGKRNDSHVYKALNRMQ